MLEKIKNVIFSKYNRADSMWLFFSVFDTENKIQMSNGVLYTDKVLDNIIDTLYNWLVSKVKNISFVAVDLVVSCEELSDISKINDISLMEYGVALIAGSKYWAVLPNTAGITSFSDALKYMKEKNWLEWNAKIYIFKTDRIVIK